MLEHEFPAGQALKSEFPWDELPLAQSSKAALLGALATHLAQGRGAPPPPDFVSQRLLPSTVEALRQLCQSSLRPAFPVPAF